ncbi:P-II family nitrogen regulator [soil metagenome]
MTDFQLIVTIVNSGNALKVIDASKRAGAEGGTIIHGRGAGIHEQARLLSIPIQPEKDIVLTLVPRATAPDVLAAIIADCDLNKPGHGIGFVLDVEEAVGITHLTPN